MSNRLNNRLGFTMVHATFPAIEKRGAAAFLARPIYEALRSSRERAARFFKS
jgi:hypothetical protein